MRPRSWIAASVLGLVLPLMAHAQEEVKVRGRIVDAAGKPVAGAEIATFWYAKNHTLTPYKPSTTDAGGHFTLTTAFYGRARALLSLDKDRKMGGLALVEPKGAAKPVEIKFAPLVLVHGKFFCKELGKRPAWTNVYISKGQARLLGYTSDDACFSFPLPPGTYKFWGYGTDFQDIKKDIIVQADTPDLDLKELDAPATILARHKGKPPPAWHVTDVRGVTKDVKLSDFKGKWVFLEFWGHW